MLFQVLIIKMPSNIILWWLYPQAYFTYWLVPEYSRVCVQHEKTNKPFSGFIKALQHSSDSLEFSILLLVSPFQLVKILAGSDTGTSFCTYFASCTGRQMAMQLSSYVLSSTSCRCQSCLLITLHIAKMLILKSLDFMWPLFI